MFQHDYGFACVHWGGTRHGDLFGVSGTIPLPSGPPKRSKWQDRRIIPDKASCRGRSRSVLSREEVACPCCVGVPVGLSPSGRIRVMVHAQHCRRVRTEGHGIVKSWKNSRCSGTNAVIGVVGLISEERLLRSGNGNPWECRFSAQNDLHV